MILRVGTPVGDAGGEPRTGCEGPAHGCSCSQPRPVVPVLPRHGGCAPSAPFPPGGGLLLGSHPLPLAPGPPGSPALRGGLHVHVQSSQRGCHSCSCPLQQVTSKCHQSVGDIIHLLTRRSIHVPLMSLRVMDCRQLRQACVIKCVGKNVLQRNTQLQSL